MLGRSVGRCGLQRKRDRVDDDTFGAGKAGVELRDPLGHVVRAFGESRRGLVDSPLGHLARTRLRLRPVDGEDVRPKLVGQRLDVVVGGGVLFLVGDRGAGRQGEAGGGQRASSKGVTEARDVLGGLFGDARLLSLLQDCCGQWPDEVARRILASIREYVGTAPQSDDITVTIVRFGPA